jgi:hypothetical protein
MIFSISACVVAPSKAFVRTHPDFDSKFGRISHVSVIADVCLFKDNLGDDDYWVVQESRSAEGHMLNAAKTYLISKGYDVKYVQAPFVGAFKNREMLFKVYDTNGEKVLEKNPPLYESEILANNPAFREALLKVIPKITASQGRDSNIAKICCSDPDIKDSVNIIAKNVNGDATLFLIGHGKIVSAGKQITEGLATGLVTAVLTLGMVSVIHSEVSFMDTYAVLVDNNTGDILWSNVMRLKGDGFTEEAYYDVEGWPKNILYHMPSKMDVSRIKEVTPKSNQNPLPAKDASIN